MAVYLGTEKIQIKAGSAADSSPATATPSDILVGETAWVNNEMVTGTCTFDADTSSGTATASELIAGKIAFVDGAQITGTMVDRGTVNIIPSTTPQSIAQGYHSGSGVVSGDADLIASNIKSGVQIFGVDGTLTPQSDQSDATAVAADLDTGKTAYVNNAKITGTGNILPSVITAGDTPIFGLMTSAAHTNTYSFTATGLSLTIAKAGTYRFKTILISSHSGDYYSVKSRLYKNAVAVGSERTTSSQLAYYEDITCAIGDVITVYHSTPSGGIVVSAGIIACINWTTGL